MDIINLPSKTDLSGFHIFFNGSTLNESPGTYGIAHLMEHLVCKSFDKHIEEFENDGIEWNAYTTSTYVLFYFMGLDKYLSKHIDKIMNGLFTFDITEEQLENEKKIVIEEYKDSFNSQKESHYNNLFRKIYDNYNAIGLRRDIENVDMDTCKRFFELQYSKPSNIVNITNNRIFESEMEFNKKEFDSKLKFEKRDKFFYEPGNDYEEKSSIINIHLIEEDFAYVHFICQMLGQGLKSPLYKQVREEKGLVYYIWCYLVNTTNKSGNLIVSTETSDGNVQEVQDTIFEVIDNPEKYMTKERFGIIKQYNEILFAKQEIDRYANIGDYVLPHDQLVSKIIGTVTYDKIMEVYNKHFSSEKFYKSIDKEEFRGL